MEPIKDYEPIFPDRPVVYGTFWERFAASFIDGIIIGIPLAVIKYFTQHHFWGRNSAETNLLNLVVNWLYSALMESGEGQATLGKRAMGLKVTDMAGGRISFGKATGRYFGKFVSAIILLIGYLMMLWDDKKQTLHDKMAGTLVVKA
ncbi:MAG: RDD family protein [Bacteroidetes bacterium]|nr:RDD family protein [Bacteroidota bacterium]